MQELKKMSNDKDRDNELGEIPHNSPIMTMFEKNSVKIDHDRNDRIDRFKTIKAYAGSLSFHESEKLLNSCGLSIVVSDDAKPLSPLFKDNPNIPKDINHPILGKVNLDSIAEIEKMEDELFKGDDDLLGAERERLYLSNSALFNSVPSCIGVDLSTNRAKFVSAVVSKGVDDKLEYEVDIEKLNFPPGKTNGSFDSKCRSAEKKIVGIIRKDLFPHVKLDDDIKVSDMDIQDEIDKQEREDENKKKVLCNKRRNFGVKLNHPFARFNYKSIKNSGKK